MDVQVSMLWDDISLNFTHFVPYYKQEHCLNQYIQSNCPVKSKVCFFGNRFSEQLCNYFITILYIQPNVNQLSPESKQFMTVDLSMLVYCNQCLLLLLSPKAALCGMFVAFSQLSS